MLIFITQNWSSGTLWNTEGGIFTAYNCCAQFLAVPYELLNFDFHQK